MKTETTIFITKATITFHGAVLLFENGRYSLYEKNIVRLYV